MIHSPAQGPQGSPTTHTGPEGAQIAQPVLLVSTDPMLGSALRTVHTGDVRVALFDPDDQPVGWPGTDHNAVVLDVPPAERAAALAWVRGHHRGHLLVVLRPDEQAADLQRDPGLATIRRPFPIRDLAEALARPAAAPRRSRSAPGGSPMPRRRRRLARLGIAVGLVVLAALLLAAGWLATTLGLR
jgi:hypothetical protein